MLVVVVCTILNLCYPGHTIFLKKAPGRGQAVIWEVAHF